MKRLSQDILTNKVVIQKKLALGIKSNLMTYRNDDDKPFKFYHIFLNP